MIYLRSSTIISKQEAKEKLSLPESKFLTWRGGDVHYADEGSGFPVVMIHGLGGSLRNFGKIAELLKDDYRCIRVDLPGFGLSDMPPMTQQIPDYGRMYREFFRFFLDTLHLDSFYVMGNSMGGWMAWEIAARYPERVKKLVLLCSAGYDMEKIARRVSRGMNVDLMEKISERGIPRYVTENNVERCFAVDTRISPEEVDAAWMLNNREGNIHWLFELIRHRRQADTTLLTKISCPTLIVWGKQDEIISVEYAYRFQRDIPHNKLIIYEDCGHVPMIEKAEQLERDFLEFARKPNTVRSDS